MAIFAMLFAHKNIKDLGKKQKINDLLPFQQHIFHWRDRIRIRPDPQLIGVPDPDSDSRIRIRIISDPDTKIQLFFNFEPSQDLTLIF